jgi:3'-phosphoadenosine 5'-phosphosulfate sulfotransferase (PAPS reductase)/FAD synthetase
LEQLKGIDQPIGVAYGLGVDSTAMLVGLYRQKIRPAFILFADVGSEKVGTYAYLPIIQAWLKSVGFPPVVVVKYGAPLSPYTTIEGNMVMNATLPGATFGRGSCTLKWKVAPQNKWTDKSPICQAAWVEGKKVIKLIGFEDGEQYRKKKANDRVHTQNDPKFEYVHPLIDWHWDREQCKVEIAKEGLPVPPKSACIFCPNQKPHELQDLTEEERGMIVRMEVIAEPFNTKVHGLWRRPRKKDGRPGSITKYMIENEIPFKIPTDEMPLNPKCQKFERGYTFKPPHDAPYLRGMLTEEQRKTLGVEEEYQEFVAAQRSGSEEVTTLENDSHDLLTLEL